MNWSTSLRFRDVAKETEKGPKRGGSFHDIRHAAKSRGGVKMHVICLYSFCRMRLML